MILIVRIYMVIILVACILPKKGKSTNIEDPKIWEGAMAEEGEFPWMVFLVVRERACGGGLITPNVALTACHCLSIREEDKVQERTADDSFGIMGVNDIKSTSSNKQIRAAKRFLLHPECQWDVYPEFPLIKDGGAVIFHEPFNITSTVYIIKPITMEQWTYLESTAVNFTGCYLSGYGHTYPESQQVSRYLKKLRVLLLSEMGCAQYFDCGLSQDSGCLKLLKLSGMSCAQGPGSPCPGDSGSPYVCFVQNKWWLVGLHSSDSCSDKIIAPYVFTSPRTFLDITTKAQTMGESQEMSSCFYATPKFWHTIVYTIIKLFLLS